MCASSIHVNEKTVNLALVYHIYAGNSMPVTKKAGKIYAFPL
jgi:hypothetical protein